MNSYHLGIDVGGTKTEVAVATGAGQILGTAITATDDSGGDGLLKGIKHTIDSALAAGQVDAGDVTAIGLGVPGQVDPTRGVVRLAVNLNLTSYPLGQKLAQHFDGVPLALENDVRLAAVGVYHSLRERHALDSLAYLSVGTGISAGIVIDGALYRGAGGMAGEIGHVVVEPGGHRCNCGLRGCLETIASGPAISRQAAPFLAQDGQPPTTAQVYEAATDGNRHAQQLVQRVSTHLGRAIHWLAMTYDVERIVLGGGVAGAGAAFWSPVSAELDRLRKQSPLAHSLLPENRVALLPGDFNPGVRGALTLARKAAKESLPSPTNP